MINKTIKIEIVMAYFLNPGKAEVIASVPEVTETATVSI